MSAQRTPRAVVAEILGVPPADLQPTDGLLTHPGWDSQAHVEIMAWLNGAFAVPFTEESMHRFSTLQAIEDHCAAQAGAPT